MTFSTSRPIFYIIHFNNLFHWFWIRTLDNVWGKGKKGAFLSVYVKRDINTRDKRKDAFLENLHLREKKNARKTHKRFIGGIKWWRRSLRERQERRGRVGYRTYSSIVSAVVIYLKLLAVNISSLFIQLLLAWKEGQEEEEEEERVVGAGDVRRGWNTGKLWISPLLFHVAARYAGYYIYKPLFGLFFTRIYIPCIKKVNSSPI